MRGADWPALEAVLGDLRAAPGGRPSYPPLVMLRMLLLAQRYGLSDPELEEALADRTPRSTGLAGA